LIAAADLTEALRRTRGAFVTLWTHGEPRHALRGCIGTLEPRDPLYRSVIKNAASAALEDPRFSPVRAEELPGLSIEISALSPLVAVAGPEAIVVGRDGVQLEKDGRKSTFLPQVAIEQGWGVEEMLRHLARKAGIVTGEWRGGSLAVFRAEVFEEPALT
jgi:AmmeMemoRadiSam system protein A